MTNHVARKLARANPDEGNAIAMLRIHVGLNLEDKRGKFFGGNGDGHFFR